MRVFLVLLIVLWAGIAGYTSVVAVHHGMGLLKVFFGDMAAMGWPGQFNLDFMSLLVLSGLWVAWRHRFSAGGLLLGLLAFFGGGLFLTAYLFIVSGRAQGDMRQVLLGQARGNALAAR
jgi:hypothetical protein